MTLPWPPPSNAPAPNKPGLMMPRWRRLTILLAAIAAFVGAALAFFVAASVWVPPQLPWSPALDLGFRHLAASASLLGLLLFAGLLEVAKGFAQLTAPFQGPSEVAPADTTERRLTEHEPKAWAVGPRSTRATIHYQPEQASVTQAEVAAWLNATVPDDAR